MLENKKSVYLKNMNHKIQLGIFMTILVVILVLAYISAQGKEGKLMGKDNKSKYGNEEEEQLKGCYDTEYCQPSMEAFYPHTRGKQNPYEMPKHNPGHDIYGYNLNNNYCRYGLGQEGIVDGENDLWRFQIYTVQPSMVNLKFQKLHM